MALKYINNIVPHSLPTTSSPEESAHAITTRLQSSLFISRNKGVKRRRGESDSDISDSDRTNSRLAEPETLRPRQREQSPAVGQPKRRTRKRTRVFGPDMLTNYTTRDEYETEEDIENGDHPLRQPAPLTGKLRPILISTRQEPVVSEYSHVNSFLRALHLNRATNLPTTVQGTPKLPSNVILPPTSPSRDRHGDSKDVEVGQRERDSVARTYEEANRALGQLMLSRHTAIRTSRRSPPDDSSDDEDSNDS